MHARAGDRTRPYVALLPASCGAAVLGVLLLAIPGTARAGSHDQEMGDLQDVLDAVSAASSEMRLTLLAAGLEYMATHHIWDAGTCPDAWKAWSRAPMETRRAEILGAFPGCPAMCPVGPLRGETMLRLGLIPAQGKTAALVAACDAAGPDPVFTGELAPLREQMSVEGFWVYRSALEHTLQRLDEIGGERAESLRVRFEALVPWVAAELSCHLPPLDAGLRIPETTSRRPARPVRTVTVTRHGIAVDGDVICPLSEGVVDEERRDGRKIVPLFDALVERVNEPLPAPPPPSEPTLPPPPPPPPDPGPSEGAEGPQKSAKLSRAKGPPISEDKLVHDRELLEAAGLLAELPASLAFPEGFRGRLLVQMDRDLPSSLLLDVLYTAGQVRYGEFTLAGFHADEGRQTVVDVSLPALGGAYLGFDPYKDRPPLNLTLMIETDGYRLLGTAPITDSPGDPVTVPLKDGGHDTAALHDLLLQIKDEYPDEENVIVVPGMDIPHRVLVATLDASREKPEPGERWPEPLFPFVVLAAGGEGWDPGAGAEGTYYEGGLGSRGGSGSGSGGLGGLGTKGGGAGASGYGSGGGYFGRQTGTPQAGVGGDPVVLGALDKALIEAVIKRHLAQIRYCYQRELTKQPDLAGKVTIKFVINSDGAVQEAEVRSTTLGNATVEECLVTRFLRMQFPEPEGGGIVIVSYPFLFQTAEDDGT